MKRARVRISGRVQAVGFRFAMQARAEALALEGWVRNAPDGTVEAAFEGDDDRVESLVEWCRRGPRGAVVAGIDVRWEQPSGERGFVVR